MAVSSTNGRVYHRAAPTQRISTQKKTWDAACEASNQADQKAGGFLQPPNRARGGEVGEPQRATPFPTAGAARTPKFNAPIPESTHLVCAAGRKHQGGWRQEKGSHSSQPWNFHLLSAASARRGQTRLRGCGQASKFQLITGQVRRITVLNAEFKLNTGNGPVKWNFTYIDDGQMGTEGREGRCGVIHLCLAAEEQVRRKRRQNRTSSVNLSPLFFRQLAASPACNLPPAAQTRQPSPRRLRWRHLRTEFQAPRFNSVGGKLANRFRARWYLWPHSPGSSTERARG